MSTVREYALNFAHARQAISVFALVIQSQHSGDPFFSYCGKNRLAGCYGLWNHNSRLFFYPRKRKAGVLGKLAKRQKGESKSEVYHWEENGFGVRWGDFVAGCDGNRQCG
ncbi:MAG: hypothetical protein PHU78_05975 [Heliobacteriaceae bacterium]|nr:hypothetical protein [Heliobacteriaceae bacterium]